VLENFLRTTTVPQRRTLSTEPTTTKEVEIHAMEKEKPQHKGGNNMMVLKI